MPLTDRLKTAARKTACVGITLASLIGPSISPAYSEEANKPNSQTQNQERDYTFEDFKKAYGDKKLADTNVKYLENFWKAHDRNGRKVLFNIYNDPENFIKDYFTKDKKEKFEGYFPFNQKREDQDTKEMIKALNRSLTDSLGFKVDLRNLTLPEKLRVFLEGTNYDKLRPVSEEVSEIKFPKR